MFMNKYFNYLKVSALFVLALFFLASCSQGGKCANCATTKQTGNLIVNVDSPVTTVVNGVQQVPISFSAPDGLTFHTLQITNGLADISSTNPGWQSKSPIFVCKQIDGGNACVLNLTFAPTNPSQTGTLTLGFSYTDNLGMLQTGTVSVIYTATTTNNIHGLVTPSSQINVIAGGSQAITIAFVTDDGKPATNFQVTNDLTNLNSANPGWQSDLSPFQCKKVTSGNGCLLNLTFAPTNINDDGTLTLGYSYIDNSGTAKTGSISIFYNTTSDNNVNAQITPSGQLNVVTGGSQEVMVTFTTDDSESATNLQLESNLANMGDTYPGWSTSSPDFSCNKVDGNNGCSFVLSFQPTNLSESGVVQLNYSYLNNAGITKTGSINIVYKATSDNNVNGVTNPSSPINVVKGGTQAVNVSFTTDDGLPATNFQITSGLANLSTANPGWSSNQPSFACNQVNNGNGCVLALSYHPAALSESGTLQLTFSYLNNAGITKNGSVNIVYKATSNNNVTGVTNPSSPINVVKGGTQAVNVSFTTDDGLPATNFQIESGLANLSSANPGWSSTQPSFACNQVDNGNGCVLALSYHPAALSESGTLQLSFSYLNNAGIAKTGSVNIVYKATSNNNVTGVTNPSSPINVVKDGTQAVNVTFTTDDGLPATNFQIESGLANLSTANPGWSSNQPSFACNQVDNGNGCSLALSYHPAALSESGTLQLTFSYLNNAGIAKTGSVNIVYKATTNNNVTGVTNPSSPINVVKGGTQAVNINFTTDDGLPATNFQIESGLANLSTANPGWSSNQPSFACNQVDNGNGCSLALSYHPTALSEPGTLQLAFSYLNNAGITKNGSVNIVYKATSNNNVTGVTNPSSPINVVKGSTQAVNVSFTTDDGLPATNFQIESGLANLSTANPGWSSNNPSFSCNQVDNNGSNCSLALAYSPTELTQNGTVQLAFSYLNNAGITKTGSISIIYNTTTVPQASLIDPNNNAVNVSPGTTIIVQFNKKVNNVTVSNVSLKDKNNTAVTFSSINQLSDNQYLLTPASTLKESMTYTLTLGSGIVDDYGNQLSPASFKFTTGFSYGLISSQTEKKVVACALNGNTFINCHDAGIESTVFGSSGPIGLAYYGKYVYVGSPGGVGGTTLFKCEFNRTIGKLNSCLAVLPRNDFESSASSNLVGLTVYGDYIYFTNYLNNTISECKLDSQTGSLSNCIVRIKNDPANNLLSSPQRIYIQNNKFYASNVDGNLNVISCSLNSLDGSLNNCNTFINASLSSPRGMSIRNNYMYVANTGNSTISMCNLSVNPISCVNANAALINGPAGLSIFNNYLFYNNINGTIPVTSCSFNSDNSLNCVDAQATGISTANNFLIW
jgi:hypothetical protein